MHTKRYFYKRGHRPPRYDWLSLYKAIQDFKMIFKFSYDLRNGLLRATYVPRKLRWFGQMRFLQFYMRLLRRVRWYQLSMRKLFFFLGRAKRLCYVGLIKQKNK